LQRANGTVSFLILLDLTMTGMLLAVVERHATAEG
jgi:hypothetical protein